MPASGSSAPLRTEARSGHKRKWATHRIATADRTVPVVVLGRHQKVTARPSSIVAGETRAGKTTTLLHVGRACHPIHSRRHGGSRSRSRAGTGHRHAGPHLQPERGPWPPNSPATSTHPPRPSTRPGRTEHPYAPRPRPPTPHRPQAAGHPTPAPTKPGCECVHRCADRPAGQETVPSPRQPWNPAVHGPPGRHAARSPSRSRGLGRPCQPRTRCGAGVRGVRPRPLPTEPVALLARSRGRTLRGASLVEFELPAGTGGLTRGSLLPRGPWPRSARDKEMEQLAIYALEGRSEGTAPYAQSATCTPDDASGQAR